MCLLLEQLLRTDIFVDAAFSINPAVDVGQVRDYQHALTIGTLGRFHSVKYFSESSRVVYTWCKFSAIHYVSDAHTDEILEENSRKS